VREAERDQNLLVSMVLNPGEFKNILTKLYEG
jgi:hypothetical protein